MSLSPSVCSPTYVLTTTPKDSGSSDYFNLSAHPSSSPDYFTKNVHGRYPKLLNKKFNESSSSLNSDGTLVDHSFKRVSRHDSSNSTHTFVDDSPSHKFNMSLNLPGLSLAEADESKRSASFSLNSSVPAPPPLLLKQLTSPSLKSFQDVKLKKGLQEQQNYRELIGKLYSNIEYVSNAEVNSLLAQVSVVDGIDLPNLLAIDIRSFTDFVKLHIRYSLNICLPSTLLKRPNFSFSRCINSLPLYDKMIFKTYFNYREGCVAANTQHEALAGIPCSSAGFPAIFIYDSVCYSANVYFMLKKVVEFFRDSNVKIYLMNENFAGSESNAFMENGNIHHFDVTQLMENDTNLYKNILINTSPTRTTCPPGDRFRSSSLNELPTVKSLTVAPEIIESSTPLLANFQLPTIEKKFSIRHNEEVFENNFQPQIDIDRYKDHRASFPDWLYNAAADQAYLVTKFNTLEKIEKARLNQALSIKNHDHDHDIDESIDPLNDIPIISSGIEFGHKNRYKDIFVFEHSRVKLNDTHMPQMCDYINASYIDSIKDLKMVGQVAGHNYTSIASQAPMEHTVGDFWKCVVNNNCSIIVTLTDTVENGVQKCEPFWKSNVYYSNKNLISIAMREEETIGNIKVRKIGVSMDGSAEREVLQIHMLNWLDNQICDSFNDLIRVIHLKNHLIDTMNLQDYSTIVHCSAGCGRTGTFIATDTLINLSDKHVKITNDIIPKLINNLRKQRISMVQNMRQFCSVYEILLGYCISQVSSLDELTIIKQFISKNTKK